MKKKIFGIKISTYLSVIISLVFAILFWLLVKYAEYNDSQPLYSDNSAVVEIFSDTVA